MSHNNYHLDTPVRHTQLHSINRRWP